MSAQPVDAPIRLHRSGDPWRWAANFRRGEALVQRMGLKVRGRAMLATASERQSFWPRLVAMYPYFTEYQERTERQIPVVTIFENDVFTIEDQRFDYGETRYITFGLFRFRVLLVVHTHENEVIRIISARKASKYEEEQFSKQIGH